MTKTTRRAWLTFCAAIMIGLLAGFLLDPALTRGAQRPADPASLGAWMNDHPADWLAANAISETALDSNLPRRIELWRAAYEHAAVLAPRKPHPRTSFVRGGLFHWYELPPPERQAVLAAAAPLLQDPRTFNTMRRPLWELTRDLGWLRRHAPADEKALAWLRDTAATNGLFNDYRELRDAVDRQRLRTFTEYKSTLAPPELIQKLPSDLTIADEPLVLQLLAELQRRPLDSSNAALAKDYADRLVGFAIDHDLRPLDGLSTWIDTPSVKAPTRARLALALGRPDAASNIELVGGSRSSDWSAYFFERSAFEAARGDAAMARLYRGRADAVLGAAQWRGTCGKNEVCRRASASFTAKQAGEPIAIDIQNAQSDEVPPYVEVYVNDVRVADGPVQDARHVRVPAPEAGLNRVDVRLVNPRTRNGLQRRVRLS